MTDHKIDHDGVRFHCRTDGPEGAPWVVFSNSLATDLTLWDAQVEALAGRFRCLRYDTRGHGGTSVPDGAASVEQLAADADALMAQFGIERAAFVGVSLGAATGLCLAAAGGRVERLLAADGNAATPAGGSAAWDERLAVAREQGMAAFADITLPRWFTPASIAARHPAVGRARAMITATPVEGLAACIAALRGYDLGDRLGAIAVPVLLLAGREDGALPRTLAALAGEVAGARFVEVGGAGHLPPMEQPEAFNAVLESFLG